MGLKPVYLLSLLMLVSFKAYSQEFLNAGKKQISAAMAGTHAVLKFDNKMAHEFSTGPENMIYYALPKRYWEKEKIRNFTFFVLNDKCYEYLVDYTDMGLMETLAKKYDNPNSGFKRIGKDLKWIDSTNKFKISIYKLEPASGRSSGVQFMAYIIKDEEE